MMLRPQYIRRQSGMVLITALMFLVILTMFGIAAINGTSSAFRAVGNMQSRNFAISLAQSGIEQYISTSTVFYTPAAAVITIQGQKVNVTAPQCAGAATADGYDVNSPVSPDDTRWELGASVTDSVSGSNVSIRQGVKMIMKKGTGCG